MVPNKQVLEGSRLASLETEKIEEMLERESVDRISWIDTTQKLAGILTKKGVAADPLMQTLTKEAFEDKTEKGGLDWDNALQRQQTNDTARRNHHSMA